MEAYTVPTLIGVTVGFLTRLIMLKTDYRQYPTYPHGSIIHLALGLIAAGLGSIVVPALVEKEFTAITFLTLAAQQFREVRNMERNTLTELDNMELVSRGKTYIEGIAMAFEGRNYLVILTSLITTTAALFLSWWIGIATGLLCMLFAYIYKSGGKLVKIAEIEVGELRFDGPNLFVGDIHIMNVGVKRSQELIMEHGLGIIVKPKTMDSVVTLSNLGQRQAILHNLSVALGVYRDTGNPSLTPLTKRNIDDGRVAVFILPQIRHVEQALNVVAQVPILENAVRIPSESDAIQNKGGMS